MCFLPLWVTSERAIYGDSDKETGHCSRCSTAVGINDRGLGDPPRERDDVDARITERSVPLSLSLWQDQQRSLELGGELRGICHADDGNGEVPSRKEPVAEAGVQHSKLAQPMDPAHIRGICSPRRITGC